MIKIINALPLLLSLLLSCDVLSGVYNDRSPFLAGEKYTFSAGAVLFKMVYVPGGTFPTGIDDLGGNQTISTPFWMAETEVTYELWDTVYTWATGHGYTFANVGTRGNSGSGSTLQPVTTINWRDAMVWCNALTEYYNANNGTNTDFDCVYYADAGYTTPIRSSSDGGYIASVNSNAGGFDNPYVKSTAIGFRLSGRMEWECAARYTDGTNWTPGNYASGATTDYNDATATQAVAWYTANSGPTTKDVKGKAGNALGIYDMSGNVYEWCFDWHITDKRVIRGGSFNYGDIHLQVGYMPDGPDPYLGFDHVGFRFARTQ